MENKVLVTGAGGFIGNHLVNFLTERGVYVRGVDIKEPDHSTSSAHEFITADLRDRKSCFELTEGISQVCALAADMGGMGFISANNSAIFRNNLQIDTNTIEAARLKGVKRIFYASSACIYPEYKQEVVDVTPLREEDAYPAKPQDAYGWEKLMTELMLGYYCQDYNLETRIARFHNIYGPLGTWEGGREKAPAALCRKIALAKLTGNPEVEIWGDGEQTRSFCYIDDCVEGIWRLMNSSYNEPLNIGQDRIVSINQLADIIAEIAGIKIKKIHVPGPQGVRGRNSDNSRLKQVLGWEPNISLETGLAQTYRWIETEVSKKI